MPPRGRREEERKKKEQEEKQSKDVYFAKETYKIEMHEKKYRVRKCKRNVKKRNV
jgi:hypothetical protein